MTGLSTAADNVARTTLCLGSAEQNTVFNRQFTTYSGAPTTPVLKQTISCDEPTPFDVSVVFGDDNVFVTVEYNNLEFGFTGTNINGLRCENHARQCPFFV